MNNLKINEYCAKYNVKKWEVADKLGVSDTSFSKWLRKPLSTEKEKKIFDIIVDIAKKNGTYEEVK